MNVRKIMLVTLLLLTANAFAGTAFLKYQYVDGMNRICVYDHLGSKYIMTIKSFKVCPVTVEV